jgi:transposase-like protein
MKKPKRHFSDEAKRAAVDEYVSGRKSAAQVAGELNVAVGLLYKWRVALSEAGEETRAAELETDGLSPEHARRFRDLENQITEYQKKVGEQAVMIDLLKKLRQSKNYQPGSELTGLIETTKSWAPKRKPAK